MANKHEKMSVSVVVKERGGGIKMAYHFLQYNLQSLKRNDKMQLWQGQASRHSCTLLVGMSVWQYLSKALKNMFTFSPSSSFS